MKGDNLDNGDIYFVWDNGLLRKLTSYSGWSLLVNAAYIIATQCQNIFLNWFGGVAINAAMGIANYTYLHFVIKSSVMFCRCLSCLLAKQRV